ncbi:hypothetical protein GE061_007758 [Apolygus lucorum]|uniref:Uncharacterized protein n=1 Tax=Apolygus lucorum TaxID=248454 RepID=A0A6A4IRF7_APOLU|nr:hypothetical protein GE061_007758 [Apolygus lucorum]
MKHLYFFCVAMEMILLITCFNFHNFIHRLELAAKSVFIGRRGLVQPGAHTLKRLNFLKAVEMQIEHNVEVALKQHRRVMNRALHEVIRDLKENTRVRHRNND